MGSGNEFQRRKKGPCSFGERHTHLRDERGRKDTGMLWKKRERKQAWGRKGALHRESHEGSSILRTFIWMP